MAYSGGMVIAHQRRILRLGQRRAAVGNFSLIDVADAQRGGEIRLQQLQFHVAARRDRGRGALTIAPPGTRPTVG